MRLADKPDTRLAMRLNAAHRLGLPGLGWWEIPGGLAHPNLRLGAISRISRDRAGEGGGSMVCRREARGQWHMEESCRAPHRRRMQQGASTRKEAPGSKQQVVRSQSTPQHVIAGARLWRRSSLIALRPSDPGPCRRPASRPLTPTAPKKRTDQPVARGNMEGRGGEWGRCGSDRPNPRPHTHHDHHPSAPVPAHAQLPARTFCLPESQISSARYECERDAPTPVHPDRLHIPESQTTARMRLVTGRQPRSAMRLPPALAMDSHATAMHRDPISSPEPPPQIHSTSSCGLPPPPFSLDCL